ncbi:PqqD family protein [Erythrobacter crassostreae]|uniref:PqqD family protein n=1 Tax=Erythrobacter crassostreae TaxID=2828328 RepID=A0A9X1F2A4_9SPHN|nr:PqqD family protein [Erythrobacter crassostrea]MBV7258289.1 PqqD family protein [Erythrobacter crassostrea]
MKLTDRYSASEDVVAREVSGETVLLDLKSGQYFGLDSVGGRIWSLLSEKSRSLTEMCDVIEEEFDASRDLIERDMLALLNDLKERELVALKSA